MSKSSSQKILATIIACSLATASFADNLRGFYAGGGGAIVDGNEADANGSSPNFRVIQAVGGYKYASWAGGEIRLGTGLSDENFSLDANTDIKIGVSSYAGIYYRPELVNQEAKLYGLLGYSLIETSSSGDNQGGIDTSDSGLSYGIGVGFVMNDDMNINFEYLEYINQDNTNFSGFSMIFDYRI